MSLEALQKQLDALELASVVMSNPAGKGTTQNPKDIQQNNPKGSTPKDTQQGNPKEEIKPSRPTEVGKGKTQKGGKSSEVNRDVFWFILGKVTDEFSRDQKVELAKMIAGQLGAILSFPAAHEAQLRREVVRAAVDGAKTTVQQGPRQKAKKPLNAAIKATVEEKNLTAAQTALRDKRKELGLAKDDHQDPRLAELSNALDKAKALHKAKTEELRKTL
jgi:hypothetical protein